ncbi:major facilitator superfamily domain-containing protein [Aspergillus recurvatus]
MEVGNVDDATSTNLRWKLNLRLLPLLCITYALQWIDKTTLSYAAVFGLEDDLHLKSSEYSWLGAISYLGYLVWEFPTNVMLQKLPINYFTAGTPFRMGIWIGSARLGYVIAGIASFGIGHIHSAGAITVAWGLVLLIFLSGSPLRTKFMKNGERELVVARVKDNATGIENKEFKWGQFWEATMGVKTWLLFLFAVTSNSPNGGLTSSSSALWLLPSSNPYGRLVCLWISFAYSAAWSLSMSVATANTAGHTKKKITTNAFLIIGYCLGNFIGPFFFKPDQKPRYPHGVGMMFFCIAVLVICLVGLRVLIWWRNSKREGMLDETGFENEYLVRILVC